MENETLKKLKAAVAKLKAELRAGEATFIYIKKDGQPRPARGTLCEALMPKKVPTRKFKIANIVWDTLEEEAKGQTIPKLFTHKTLHIPIAELEGKDPGEVDEIICEKLTELGKFTVLSLDILEDGDDKPAKELPDTTIFYYDLDKQAFRSFDETQLVIKEN